MEGHHDAVLGVTFNADGKRVVSCSHDKMIRVWETMSGKPIRRMEVHRSIVYNVSFSPMSGDRLMFS